MSAISTVQAGDLQLAVREMGSGPGVLLLHPFPLDSSIFDPLADALARERRVILVDFPGFGQSPPASNVSFRSYALALRELLAKRQLSQLDAIGTSMGAYTLLELSHQAPMLFSRLVLAGARASAPSEEAKAKHEARARRAETIGVGWLEAEWTPLLLCRNPELSAQRTVAKIMRRATPQGVAGAARALAQRLDQSAQARLASARTLVVHGAEDQVTPVQEAEALTDLLAHGRLEVIPGAGHVPNVDEPEHFTRAVLSFLEE